MLMNDLQFNYNYVLYLLQIIFENSLGCFRPKNDGRETYTKSNVINMREVDPL